MKKYIKHEFLNVITNGVIAGNAVAFLDLDIYDLQKQVDHIDGQRLNK